MNDRDPEPSGSPRPSGPLAAPEPDRSSQALVPAAKSELRFAVLIGGIGAAILLMALVLVALPSVLPGPPLIFVIAFGTAALFGPVGLTLLAQAWRIRNRVRHGTAVPAGQRRATAILGAALVAVGAFLVFGDFGVSGALSRALNVVWGISLAAYGLRFLLRALVSDRGE